jgi:hypothetical protein
MTELTIEIGNTVFDIVVADITTLPVDAIVNAANAHSWAAAAWMVLFIARQGRSY